MQSKRRSQVAEGTNDVIPLNTQEDPVCDFGSGPDFVTGTSVVSNGKEVDGKIFPRMCREKGDDYRQESRKRGWTCCRVETGVQKSFKSEEKKDRSVSSR